MYSVLSNPIFMLVITSYSLCFGLSSSEICRNSYNAPKKIFAYRGISINPYSFNPIHVDKVGVLYAVREVNFSYAESFSRHNFPSPDAAKELLAEGQLYHGMLLEYELEPRSFIARTSTLKIEKVDNDLRHVKRIGVHDLNKIASGEFDTLIWLTRDEFVNKFISSDQQDLFLNVSRNNIKDSDSIKSQINLNLYPMEAFQIKRIVAIHKVYSSISYTTDFYLEYIDGLGRSRIFWLKNFKNSYKLLKTKNIIPSSEVSPIHFSELHRMGNFTSYKIEDKNSIFAIENGELVKK